MQIEDLRRLTVGEKVTGRDGKIFEELEGLPGGRAWFAGNGRIVPSYKTIIAYWYLMSMITYKCSGCTRLGHYPRGARLTLTGSFITSETL